MDIAVKINRPCWTEYFMNLADCVSTQSGCVRRQVGAVAVDENRIVIGTGYNDPPSGFRQCTTGTCYRTVHKIPSGEQLEKCVAIHAEANLVTQLGERLRGSVVYVTTQPCVNCFKLLVGAGVREIWWRDTYDDAFAMELMQKFGVACKSAQYWHWLPEPSI